MLKNTPIEETFRNAFDNFEADVNEQVWTNIQQNINPITAPNPENILSHTGKSVITSGKFSALFYGIASSVIIAVVCISYVYINVDKNKTINVDSVSITPLTPVNTNNNNVAVTNNLTAETKHENNLISQIPIVKNEKTPVEYDESNAAITAKQTDVPSTIDVPAVETSVDQKSNSPALNTVDKSVLPTIDNKELNSQPAAAEKHETAPAEENQVSNVLPLEKPSESDDFNWGIIANSFSPNNDGKNDAFIIKTPDLTSIEVTIYDPKNGKTIYKWNTLEGSWDGKDLSGKEMPAGFYLYSIFAQSINGKPHSTKGTIYIFR